MRLISILATAAALVCFGAATPDTASAAHKHRHHHAHHHGHHAHRAITLVPQVHYSAYANVYAIDPYAYSYQPRGYYPAYGSQYWVPAPWVHARNHALYNHVIVAPTRYDYAPSWGYPVKWHRHHAKRHHHHHHHHRGYRHHRHY